MIHKIKRISLGTLGVIAFLSIGCLPAFATPRQSAELPCSLLPTSSNRCNLQLVDTVGGGPSLPTPPCSAPAGYTKIFNANDLSAIRDHLDGNYYLCNDITLGAPWEPIGDYFGSGFAGIFEGNNHRIIGLQISNLYLGGRIGFFRFIEMTGQIKNLIFQNVTITVGNSEIGTLAGKNWGIIDNCHVTGAVTVRGQFEPWSVGGLVGSSELGLIKNSSVESPNGSVRGRQNVGGLIGKVSSGYGSISVLNSHASIPVSVDYYGAGGLVGRMENLGVIRNSYATGDVSSFYPYGGSTGGLVGIVDFSTVLKSHATGDISGAGTVGGLVGHVYRGYIENSYSRGNVFSTNSCAGGLAGQLLGYDIYNPASLSRTYATGIAITGGSTPNNAHGLVGCMTPSTYTWVSGSFFNLEANPASAGSYRGFGRTESQLRSLNNYLNSPDGINWDIKSDNDPNTSIWRLALPEGTEFPRLSGQNN